MQFSNGVASTGAGLPPQYVAVTNTQDTPTPESLLTGYHAVSGYSNNSQTTAAANNPDHQLQAIERNDWSYPDYPQDGPMSPGEFLPQGILQPAPAMPPSSSQWLRAENPLIPPSSDYQASTSVVTQSVHAPQALANTTVQASFPVDVVAVKSDSTPRVVAAEVSDYPVVDPCSFPSSSAPQSQPQDTHEDSVVTDSNSQSKLTRHSSLTRNEPLSRRLPDNAVLSDDDIALLRDASTSSTRARHSRDSRSLGGRSKTNLHDVATKYSCNDLDDYDNVGADDYSTVLRAESRSGESLVQSDSQRFIVQPGSCDADLSGNICLALFVYLFMLLYFHCCLLM